MPNGQIGDHPLTDILIHKSRVFDEEVAELIVKISKLASRQQMETLVDWLKPPGLPELRNTLEKEYARLRDEAKQRGWEVEDD
jgi:hypothetical protein